ncbi:hypothetical protein GcM1_174024 [Golovinomyces cichoracearum]|uniref:Ca3427-like PBP 2 domain-containing protein n=1 Tax=Golovinomyces cichoracearum TaxID=62708 RepID=A0A420J5Z1_9PEZI|nr:hypothetical protein GcM1_174024 [Golovinomyces cichoracearum]
MAAHLTSLRIGYVPEHFSTPLYFALKHFELDAQLIQFPSGTGHMVTCLRNGEIDVAIGLTEGWVAGLAKEKISKDQGDYRLIGTYVETPLCWAISTGANRDIDSVENLKGGTCGVSRIGSGSYVMAFALALQKNWLTPQAPVEPFKFKPIQTFERLREAVNSGIADFFMWEHFTSKKYYDNGEIKRIGEIYTPWSSWKIVASTSIPPSDARLEDLFKKLDQGIEYFEKNQDEAVKYISTSLDYSEADAQSWLKTVKFPAHTKGVDLSVIKKTVNVLTEAGILGKDEMDVSEMVAIPRSVPR